MVGHAVLEELHRPFVAHLIEEHHHTLPIISTFLNALPSPACIIRFTGNR
jgi:hypothetical protein